MTKDDVFNIITKRLGDNYNTSDSDVLNDILDEIINKAFIISNRENNSDNFEYLSPEIIEASIILYQRRGTEFSKSQSELGQSNTFIDVDEYLRTNIIKNGKRVIW